MIWVVLEVSNSSAWNENEALREERKEVVFWEEITFAGISSVVNEGKLIDSGLNKRYICYLKPWLCCIHFYFIKLCSVSPLVTCVLTFLM